MHPDHDDLIQQLTRPLEANAELHLAARSYLLEKSNDQSGRVCENAGEWESHGGAQDLTSAATQSPDILPTTTPPKHWRRWFYLAVAAMIVAIAAPFAWQACETWMMMSSWGMMNLPGPKEPYHPLKIRNLPEKDRVLFLGNDQDYSDAEKWRPLWQLEPENPAFLAQYAKTYASQTQSLSPEILETAARIDPDNALYPLLQATSGWNSVITQKFPSPAEKKAGKRTEWVIKNDAELESRIALLHRAVGMSGVRGYNEQLHARQRNVLSQPNDLSAAYEILRYNLYNSAWFALHSAPKLLAAKASQCAKQGDIAGFHSIVTDWKSLCIMSVRDGKWLVDGLITKSILSSPLEDFRDAARELGLEEEARRFDEFYQYFKREKDAKLLLRKHPGAPDPINELISQKGSVFFHLSLSLIRSQVKTPPPITADDLRPGRYAEYALFGRFVSLIAAVIFLLLAGVAALCRFRQSALVRALSPAMTVFLRVSDCLWIIGLGVLVPIAWLLVIQFLTPLGAREWSLRFTDMFVPCAQFGAAVLLGAVSTLVTAGWRLGGRGAAFGLRGKRQWIGWVMVGILVISIPAIGALPGWKPAQTERMLQFSLAVLLGAPVLWIGISLLLNLINRADQSLRRATLARVMIPAWIFAAAAFSCLIPVYHHSEKHWFQNDHLTGLTNPEVEFCRYEAEVAKVLHQELRELMEQHLQDL